ncbi:universal stress protein, partial [Thermodesulfobacteriota bacterium]
QAIETAKKHLIQAGFKQTQIDTKLHVRKISKVMDIIHEGEKGLYDAVVLGRRGLSWLAENFEDSVSKGLMEKRFNFPIWFCRGSAFNQNKVLLCLEGTDASYRAADHVGFMLKNETAYEVTLLNVNKQNEKSAESIFAKGKEHLINNGFPSQQIKEQVIISNKGAETILKVATEGQFTAVALGRKRAEHSLLKKMYKGSVTSKLLRGLEQSALLICH